MRAWPQLTKSTDAAIYIWGCMKKKCSQSCVCQCPFCSAWIGRFYLTFFVRGRRRTRPRTEKAPENLVNCWHLFCRLLWMFTGHLESFNWYILLNLMIMLACKIKYCCWYILFQKKFRPPKRRSSSKRQNVVQYLDSLKLKQHTIKKIPQARVVSRPALDWLKGKKAL